MKSPAKIYLAIILIALILIFILMAPTPQLEDEVFHFTKITDVMAGRLFTVPDITTLPGYHWTMAIFGIIFNQTSLQFFRFINVIISWLLIICIYYLAKKISPSSVFIKSLQIAAIPIIFPFFFLIYTDIFSTLLVTLSLYLAINQKPKLSGFVAILSCLVRQNNIVWLIFMAILIYQYQKNKSPKIKPLKNQLNIFSFFITGLIFFIIFLILNHGVAIGDKINHPTGSFHLGNIYFMLFTFFLLFLPLNIYNLPKILAYVRKNAFKVSFCLVVFFVIYLLTFTVDHPYNQFPKGFITNRVLYFFMSSLILKTTFFLLIAYSSLSIIVTKLKQPTYYWLYPATCLYLIPSWLIQTRYYFIPFIFFILFREDQNASIEYQLILYSIVLSSILFLATFTGTAFI